MSQRPIWLILGGRKKAVGILEQNIVRDRVRIIKVSPMIVIDGYSYVFHTLEELLRGNGYSPVITVEGKITLTMPCNDDYGWILREIARSYWMAGRVQQDRESINK